MWRGISDPECRAEVTGDLLGTSKIGADRNEDVCYLGLPQTNDGIAEIVDGGDKVIAHIQGPSTCQPNLPSDLLPDQSRRGRVGSQFNPTDRADDA